jgi:RimJ/RimL family protein N-acetyltransferase
MHEGKSYIFPNTITPLDYPDVEFSEAAACIVRDGEIVSSCQSSRENASAAEAWVFTHPDYRGRGYARQVTMAWGHRLQKQSKIPFYSHHRTNLASEAVARSLRMIQYITDVGYV